MRRLALVLLMITPVLMGCLRGDEGRSLPQGENTRELRLTLEDFPSGAEYLLMEITPHGPGHLAATLEGEWPLGGEIDPCFVHHLGASGFALLGPEGAYVVGARPAGDALMRQPSPFGGSLSWYDTREADNPGVPIPVLVSLDGAAAWVERATFSWTLRADVPFSWRVMESGPMDCVTRLRQFEEGSLVEGGGITSAEGVAHRTSTGRAIYGWALARAEQGGRFRVEGPSSPLMDVAAQTGLDASGPIASAEPGMYRAVLDAKGRDVHAALVVMDLPFAAVEAFNPK